MNMKNKKLQNIITIVSKITLNKNLNKNNIDIFKKSNNDKKLNLKWSWKKTF